MRPIDADAIKLPDELYFQPNGRSMYIASDVIEAIAFTPTLTLDDLRLHGRWLNVRILSTGDGRVRAGDCSCCGSAEKLRNFCPNCGADMRGGGEE